MIYYAESFMGLKHATAHSPERAALRVAAQMDKNDTIRAWMITNKEKQRIQTGYLPRPKKNIYTFVRNDYDEITIV